MTHNSNKFTNFTFKRKPMYTPLLFPLYNTFIPKKITNGYNHLRDMIRVRNHYPSYSAIMNPFTNRVMFILDALNEMGVSYRTDIFSRDNVMSFTYDNPKLVNIIIEFGSELKDEPAIVFEAHHDISNQHSQNCQDNSASICNLLHMCEILSKKEKHDKRVIVLFSDKEESGGTGADRFSRNANEGMYGDIQYVLSLELTGLGDKVWISTGNGVRKDSTLKQEFVKHLREDLYEVSCPFNTSVIFKKSFDSFCTGILPEKELEDGTHTTWRLCHSMEDTIDKCNEQDMEKFVELLVKFTEKEKVETPEVVSENKQE